MSIVAERLAELLLERFGGQSSGLTEGEAATLGERWAADLLGAEWRPIEEARLGRRVLAWCSGWALPWPGTVNGPEGQVYLAPLAASDDREGHQTQATHYAPLRTPEGIVRGGGETALPQSVDGRAPTREDS